MRAQIAVPAIQARIGEGFLQRVFGGKSFIHCLRELIKNCRDWGASHILIITAVRSEVRIIDDGSGMDAGNRSAFCSINTTTATGPRQAGRFCTGTKQMLFSQADQVTVRTAPQDEPDAVYVFTLTREKYEQLVLTNGSIGPERLLKNAETWPHEFPFGTDITYVLHDPSRKSILRGSKLGEELASMLPMHYGDIVTIDDDRLPAKQIEGQPFSEVSQTAQLGEVTLEVYRPKQRRGEEGLLLTAVEIGEVPIENLSRVLPPELRSMIPLVFLHPGVCGTLRAEFLKDHVNEDRFTFGASVADDPRVRMLLRHLVELAPRVEQRLKLRLSAQAESEAGERLLEDMARQLTRYYQDRGAVPPEPIITDDGTPAPFDDDGTPSERPAMQLVLPRREFAIGEEIIVEARLRPDLIEQHKDEEVRWYTDRSHAKTSRVESRRVTLTATELGHGVISADLPGTTIATQTHYDVVAQRVFQITDPHATVSIGGTLVIMTKNHDLLDDDPTWQLDGPGELKAEGRRAIFRARELGHVVVRAQDPNDSSVFATCDVTIIGRSRQLMCIRGHWFEYRFSVVENGQPVVIVRGDRVHRLMVNADCPGYKAAKGRSATGDFLRLIIAGEFARFITFVLETRDLSEIDPREFPRLAGDMLTLADSVYAEFPSST